MKPTQPSVWDLLYLIGGHNWVAALAVGVQISGIWPLMFGGPQWYFYLCGPLFILLYFTAVRIKRGAWFPKNFTR